MEAEANSRSVFVREIRQEARDVVSITLEDPAGESLPSWSAGAHIDLHVKDVGTAQYSLCGRRNDPSWKIAILHQPDGKGVSSFVHQRLRTGDLVSVSDPRNHFSLQSAQAYLFIAGGIGITPILAMTREADEAGIPWRLVYGGRSQEAMAFFKELERQASVQLFPQDRVGLLPIAEVLERAGVNTRVYCCGPEALLQAVQAQCRTADLPEPQFERFSPIAPSSDAPAHEFTVELARSNMTLTVSPTESIADVLDANGVFVPTSCREGICGSCETRVLAGIVDHRDSILSGAERKRNDTMMVCTSRARGDHIKLDI
jgi:ferredoxin-NADP reductase